MKKYETLFLSGIISEDVYYQLQELDQNGMLTEGFVRNALGAGALALASLFPTQAVAQRPELPRFGDMSREQWIKELDNYIKSMEDDKKQGELFYNTLRNNTVANALKILNMTEEQLIYILKYESNLSASLLKEKEQLCIEKFGSKALEILVQDKMVNLIFKAHPEFKKAVEEGGTDWKRTHLPGIMYDKAKLEDKMWQHRQMMDSMKRDFQKYGEKKMASSPTPTP